jgi:hypothetical protein
VLSCHFLITQYSLQECGVKRVTETFVRGLFIYSLFDETVIIIYCIVSYGKGEFEVLFDHLLGGTEKNHKEHQGPGITALLFYG